MSSNPRSGPAFVAAVCVVAMLAAVLLPAAGDPIHVVLAPVMCLAGAPASVEVPFITIADVPPDTLFSRCDPARGPPLV